MNQATTTYLTIGQLAKQTGFSAVTIRHYEKIGLIHSIRGDNGYRYYNATLAIARLHFVNNAKIVGFELKEIRQLFDYCDDVNANRQLVKQLCETKIEMLKNKINELKDFLATLSTLVERCDGQGDTAHCPIIMALRQSSEQNP